MSLRGRSAAVAILKPKARHPVPKHGSPARQISNISEIKMVGFIAKPTIFVSLRGAQRRGNLKAKDMASRGEAREQKTTKYLNFESSRSDTTTVLLRKRDFTRASASISRAQHLSHDQRSYFTAKPYLLARRATFTAQLWPCFVPGCRLAPSKIAASGAKNVPSSQ